MSELKDDLVATYDNYFRSAKEYVFFFYPTLDLSMLDIFKIIGLNGG